MLLRWCNGFDVCKSCSIKAPAAWRTLGWTRPKNQTTTAFFFSLLSATIFAAILLPPPAHFPSVAFLQSSPVPAAARQQKAKLAQSCCQPSNSPYALSNASHCGGSMVMTCPSILQPLGSNVSVLLVHFLFNVQPSAHERSDRASNPPM